MSDRENHCSECERHKQELTFFKQEVSDAIRIYSPENRNPALGRFIIAKPDPLVEALKEAAPKSREMTHEEVAQDLRTAIAKRGGKIVWGEG